MLPADPIRKHRTMSQPSSGQSVNDIALTMFPSIVEQLLAPQPVPVELPNQESNAPQPRTAKSFPRR